MFQKENVSRSSNFMSLHAVKLSVFKMILNTYEEKRNYVLVILHHFNICIFVRKMREDLPVF